MSQRTTTKGTSHANTPAEYGRGEAWYICSECGFYDHHTAKTYFPEPFLSYCAGCGTLLDDRAPAVDTNGVILVSYHTDRISNPNDLPVKLTHAPYLPHDFNDYADFPVGLMVTYRRRPDELFLGRVLPPKSDTNPDACLVLFNAWYDASWHLSRSSRPSGSIATHVIGKGGLYVSADGQQELFI